MLDDSSVMLSLNGVFPFSWRWGKFCHELQMSLRKHTIENISSRKIKYVVYFNIL